ncbi:MAG: biosynthetic arginine decarboxylase [Legionella sp.]|nr:biosynthetic arginine decarboxylase [Legionella sp.]
MDNDGLDRNLYNITQWGEGYFNINSKGNIEISKNPCIQGVELQAIVQAAQQSGLQLPLLIRCNDILHDRVHRICQAFNEAIATNNYSGTYQLVYPIKVNQEQSVVRELIKAPAHNIGLEAGSKPELMAVIGMLRDRQGTIICNGYKDSSYIRIALIAQQMGHKVYIVIEKLSELSIILKESADLKVKPMLGVRIRLMTKSAGKWADTGGSKSKFGLNAKQVLELVTQLKTHEALGCLQLMHCHLGSQIANIHDIRNCMQEIARYYVELCKLNAPITTLDVGGGLGVDYEGTQSNTDCSMNYKLSEYATHILLALKQRCEEAGITEPNLISESGRALTAHHAVLVSNITDLEVIHESSVPRHVGPDESFVIRDIYDTYGAINDSPPTEIYNYAEHTLNEAQSLFKHGVINLQEKAKVEAFYTNICIELQDRLDEDNPNEKELLVLINERMAAKIFCNISFFQSIPDAWAVGQVFPVAPITHLNEALSMHSILQDLTCDSDGTLRRYPGSACVNSTLMLPRFDAVNPYAIGFFLVGAYQEILGNLHNLFGDTNSLDVKLSDEGTFELNDLISGDTVTNVLNFAHFDTKKLIQSYEKQLIQSGLSREQCLFYLNELRSIFSQLTYLDENSVKLL